MMSTIDFGSAAKTLTAINSLLTYPQSDTALISRPHVLKLIEKYQADLADGHNYEDRIAHAALMTLRLRPFSCNNHMTAGVYILHGFKNKSGRYLSSEEATNVLAHLALNSTAEKLSRQISLYL